MVSMKSLSLNRPLVIMVLGLPGAGKSFFATQFAQTFGAPLVSVDRLHALLFAQQAYSKEEDELLSAVAKTEIDELLKTGKTFLVDGGASTRAQRMAITKTARAAGYDTLIVWVQTDEPTSRHRVTRLRGSARDDSGLNPMSDDAFARKTKQFTPPAQSEKHVVISGKHTYATQAKVVLRKLAGQRNVTVSSQRTAPSTQQISDTHVPPSPKRRSLTIN